MCMVSNIGDGWGKTIPEKYPWLPHHPSFPLDGTPVVPLPYVQPGPLAPFQGPTQEEFDRLKKEVDELRKLLEAAKKFDESTGQPHCEVDAKVKLIKEIAKLVGVDLGDVFEQKK